MLSYILILSCSSLYSPLMLNDSSTTHSMPKYSRPFSLEVTCHTIEYIIGYWCFFNELIGCLLNNPQSALFSPDSPPSGPIISDITEVHSPVEEEVVTDITHAG